MHIINTTNHDHVFLDNVCLGEVSPFLQKDRKATSSNTYSLNFNGLLNTNNTDTLTLMSNSQRLRGGMTTVVLSSMT